MLRKLSPEEKATLVTLRNSGPGANFEMSTLNNLFTLGLVEVDATRRIVLTDKGRELSKEIAPHA